MSYNNSTGAFTISQSTGSTNGYLSSTDWTTFNNKQSALTNPVTGTGTSGYVPKFNGTTTVGNSVILQGNNSTVSSVFSSATGSQAFAGMFTGQGASGNTGTMYFGAGEPNGADPSFPNIRAGLKVYQSWNGSSTDVKFDLFTLQGGVGNNTVMTGNPNGSATFSSSVNIKPTSGYALFTTDGPSGTDWSLNVNGVQKNEIFNNSTAFVIYSETALVSSINIPHSSGIVSIGVASDNGQGKLQNIGQTFTGGLGIGGLTFSTNTIATVNTSFYFFNGGAGVSLTLPDTNGQSMIYYIKNYSASPLTIARTGSNTFIAAGTITTVTSLTLATGVSTTIIGNGTTNYIQIQ